MWGTARRIESACVLLYVLAACWSSQDAARHPANNWDMIGYIGAALHREEPDLVVVHQRTYAEVRAHVSADEFVQLTGMNPRRPFREVVFRDPVAFAQQLPYYSVKPLYVSIIALVARSSGSLVKASQHVSLVCYALLLAVLFLWRRPGTGRSLWLLVVGALAYVGTSAIRDVAALATPDALSLVLSALAFLLLLRSMPHAALATAVVAIAARPDNVTLVLPLVAYLGLWAPTRWRIGIAFAAGWTAVTVLVAGGIDWACGGYPWSQVFYRGVLYIPAYPARYVPTPLVQTYLQALTVGLVRMATDLPREIVVLVVGLGLSMGIVGAGGRDRTGAWMALMATSAMIGRILVYPCVEERYFLLQLSADRVRCRRRDGTASPIAGAMKGTGLRTEETGRLQVVAGGGFEPPTFGL